VQPSQKLDAWARYATISREWVRVLDAKAGFITALNLGLMADPGDIGGPGVLQAFRLDT